MRSFREKEMKVMKADRKEAGNARPARAFAASFQVTDSNELLFCSLFSFYLLSFII